MSPSGVYSCLLDVFLIGVAVLVIYVCTIGVIHFHFQNLARLVVQPGKLGYASNGNSSLRKESGTSAPVPTAPNQPTSVISVGVPEPILSRTAFCFLLSVSSCLVDQ